MKTIKKTFEPIPDEQYDNPIEKSGLLTGFLVALTVGAGLVIILICLAAFSVYLAETIVKLF